MSGLHTYTGYVDFREEKDKTIRWVQLYDCEYSGVISKTAKVPGGDLYLCIVNGTPTMCFVPDGR